jgi:hypothetical protein
MGILLQVIIPMNNSDNVDDDDKCNHNPDNVGGSYKKKCYHVDLLSPPSILFPLSDLSPPSIVQALTSHGATTFYPIAGVAYDVPLDMFCMF